MPRSSIYLKSKIITNESAAYGLAVISRLKSLEPDFDFEIPTVKFLPDTTPKARQCKVSKNYYGESLHGTDWPDRWLFTFEGIWMEGFEE